MLKKLLAVCLLALGTFGVAPVSALAASGYQVDNAGTKSPAPGQSIVVVFNGFKPGSDVTITLFSDPVVLGTFVSERGEFGQGVVEATVTIPLSTPPGKHSLVASGIDAKGQPRTVTLEIVVEIVASKATSSLPQTGSNLLPVLAIGGMTVLLGSALLEFRRRRSAIA